MRSTFSPGEILYVRPHVSQVLPGDVVIYKHGDEYVVHRVKALTSDGLITRGDNNFHEDHDTIKIEKVIGVVDKVDSGKRIREVTGGKRGLWNARLRWGFLAVFNWMRPVIGAPYRWLKSKRIVAQVWHPQVIQVKTNSSSGPMIKYIADGKTVATWIPDLNRFQCKRVYDLVIFPPDK